MAGNSNSGRRPRPAALQILRGNPGKRPIAAPVPGPVGAVVVPATISAGGAAVWARLAPIAIAMGTLTVADCEAFKTLCELQAIFDLAARATDAPGFVAFTVVDDEDGAAGAVIHAALKLQARIAPIIRPSYGQFGLEPSARARLSVGAAPAPVSKWGALAGG